MERMATRLKVTRHRDTNNRTRNRLILLRDTLHPMLNRHLDSKAVALPSWKDAWLRFVVAAYWMLAFKSNKLDLDPLISCFAFGGKLVFMKIR
ncbi:hypothetical protein FCM35_KLT20731 [Carex littledalei]|uniref:Uncharacterized protein n=1 Tax=Carex littledalei TaxID=544730 RepID=A0A833R5D2_9POAL|nr:hypothetical protein FCM35_KLT20731 [Carex littledalei]